MAAKATRSPTRICTAHEVGAHGNLGKGDHKLHGPTSCTVAERTRMAVKADRSQPGDQETGYGPRYTHGPRGSHSPTRWEHGNEAKVAGRSLPQVWAHGPRGGHDLRGSTYRYLPLQLPCVWRGHSLI
ncbi:unnamed protein product [Calypogeia fissa]